jgi:hypothetical protein
LVYLTTCLIYLTLTSELDIDRTTDRGESIHILELHTVPKCRLSYESDRDIDITAQLPLLHIRIGRTTPAHQLLEFLQISEDIGLGSEVWLSHYLHEWRTCTVVVTESFSPCMDELTGIVLDMHVMDAERPNLSVDHRTNLSPIGNRLIELCDLVSHREIRVEVALAIEHTQLLYLATERMARTDSEIDDTC